MAVNQSFEVIIVGGSYAGLSAAMALGRSLRKVLVIDSGQPCNRQTPHSHNFLTQDGATPEALSAAATEQVEKYDTVHFERGFAVKGMKTADGFEITTQSGKIFQGRKLIFATGIKDQLPAIPGFAECWGISLVHCPYCHGYEYRGRKTGLMANGERAFHLAMMVSNLTVDLTILTNGRADFTAQQMEKLKAHNIPIMEREVGAVAHKNGYIQRLVFKDGTQQDFDVVYAAIPFIQHCDIPVSLGCALTEQGYIELTGFQKTSVPGIFACGDNAVAMRSVANAVSSGNISGAMVNRELCEENF